jgi:hypothetical protein
MKSTINLFPVQRTSNLNRYTSYFKGANQVGNYRILEVIVGRSFLKLPKELFGYYCGAVNLVLF